jgi:hypothetical protein
MSGFRPGSQEAPSGGVVRAHELHSVIIFWQMALFIYEIHIQKPGYQIDRVDVVDCMQKIIFKYRRQLHHVDNEFNDHQTHNSVSDDRDVAGMV